MNPLPNIDPNSPEGLRRTRALSLITHATERLHLCRQAIENAHIIIPHAFHTDAMGAPYLVRPGHKAGWEVSLDAAVAATEGALKILLRDARTTNH